MVERALPELRMGWAVLGSLVQAGHSEVGEGGD